jgi:protein TonB
MTCRATSAWPRAAASARRKRVACSTRAHAVPRARLAGATISHVEATYFASVLASQRPGYAPSSAKSRAGVLSLIVLAHALALFALVSIGHVVLEIVQPPMQVTLLPEPPRAAPMAAPPPVPMPQLRKPEIVIPEPPRFETITAVQVVERPGPPPPSPAPVANVAPPPVPVAPVAAPPRHDLAYLNNPAPSYPVFAKRAREQGKVLLRVQVDASGQVAGIEIHASSGFERLDKAALAAVRRWRFEPARSGDRPVAGVALVPITFQLET